MVTTGFTCTPITPARIATVHRSGANPCGFQKSRRQRFRRYRLSASIFGNDIGLDFFVSFPVDPDHPRTSGPPECAKRRCQQFMDLVAMGVGCPAKNQHINLSGSMFKSVDFAQPAWGDDGIQDPGQFVGADFVLISRPSSDWSLPAQYKLSPDKVAVFAFIGSVAPLPSERIAVFLHRPRVIRFRDAGKRAWPAGSRCVAESVRPDFSDVSSTCESLDATCQFIMSQYQPFAVIDTTNDPHQGLQAGRTTPLNCPEGLSIEVRFKSHVRLNSCNTAAGIVGTAKRNGDSDSRPTCNPGALHGSPVCKVRRCSRHGGPAGTPSVIALPEQLADEIVEEKSDGTCHADPQCAVASCEHQGVPDAEPCADRQKCRNDGRSRRLFRVWFLFHRETSFV